MSFDCWKVVKLKDISIGGKGKYGIGAPAVDYNEELYTYLRITDISDEGKFYGEDLKSVADKKAAEYVLKENDIVFARTGNSTGRSYFYDSRDGELVYAGFLIKFSLDNKKVNPKYIRYYTLSDSYKGWILSFATGSTRKNLNAQMLGDMKLDLPPRSQQDLIVNIMDAIQEKIRINDCIIKKLDEVAHLIFKSWFIDFEPFQEGEFEDSELGRIPKGWRICGLDDVTSAANTGGDAIQKTPMVDYDTGIKCVRVGDMTNGRSIDGWGFCSVNEENFKKYQLKKDDIIVTRTAALGLNQIIDENLKAVYNNGLIRLKLKTEVDPLFIYQTINTNDFIEYISRIESESSTRPNMKINYLLKYRFICPQLEIQKKFSSIIEPMRTQKNEMNKQTQILTSTRETLLSNFMNGKIQLPIDGSN